MNTEEIKAEAQRRLDAMDSQEVSRRMAEMEEMLDYVGKNGTKYLMPRQYGKLTPEEKIRYASLAQRLQSISSRRDPDQRATDDQLYERFKLTRDDMRDGDPQRLRPQMKASFWRWFSFLLLLVLSVALADILGLTGGQFGWIIYIVAMTFFGLSVNFFIFFMMDLSMNRKYKKAIPKVSSPEYQEQEVQAELDHMLLERARANRDRSCA